MSLDSVSKFCAPGNKQLILYNKFNFIHFLPYLCINYSDIQVSTFVGSLISTISYMNSFFNSTQSPGGIFTPQKPQLSLNLSGTGSPSGGGTGLFGPKPTGYRITIIYTHFSLAVSQHSILHIVM